MSVRRSIVASVAGRYVGMVIQLVGSLVMARLLTPHEFGLFGVAVAVVGLSAMLREFGVTNYLIQLPVLDRAAIGRAFGLMFSISAGLALVLLLARDWIAGFYREPELAQLLSLSVLGLLATPFGLGPAAALQRELKFVTLSLIQIPSSVLGVFGGILLAWRGHGAESLVWAQLITTASSMLLLGIVRPRETFCPPRFTGWRSMLGFGLFSTLAGLAFQFQSIAINLILGRGLGFASVGLFDRASGTVQYLNRDLLGAILQVMYVGLARAKSNESHMGWFAQLAIAHLVGLMWPAYAVVAVLAEPLVVTLFGGQWREAVPLVQALTCTGALAAFASIHSRTLLAKGRTAQLCALEWSLQLARVGAACAAIIISWNLVVVAWAQVPVYMIGVAVYLSAGHRHVHVPVRALVAIAIQGVAIAAAAALPPYLLVRYAGSSMSSLALLATAGCLAGLSWLIAVFLLRHPISAELTKALKKAQAAL